MANLAGGAGTRSTVFVGWPPRTERPPRDLAMTRSNP